MGTIGTPQKDLYEKLEIPDCQLLKKTNKTIPSWPLDNVFNRTSSIKHFVPWFLVVEANSNGRESKSSQRPFASDSTTLVFTSCNHSFFDSYKSNRKENYQKQKYKKSCKLRQSFTVSLTTSASNMSFFNEHNPLKKLHCNFLDCFNAMRFNFHVCKKSHRFELKVARIFHPIKY